MEQETTQKKETAITFDELKKNFGELHLQYQKLLGMYRQAQQSLANRSFEFTSFFLQMLFKVVEHPEMYTEEFTKWAVDNIQSLLKNYAESLAGAAEEHEAENAQPDAAE